MCGINGFTKNSEKLHGVIEKMNMATKHRGPDGVGVFSDEEVTLGQNLLAITEVPIKAKQPYKSLDGNYVLVYNGEVYNYKILREELESEGLIFKTQGDTEVVFAGLMRHGPAYFEKLDGMFAIAFYNKKEKRLFLARDRAGMKPLYYTQKEGMTCFSSELRGLFAYGVRPLLNTEVAKLFFLLGYTPGEETLIRGIKKLNPGAFMEIDLAKKTSQIEWFGWKDRKFESPDLRGDTLRAKIGKSVMEHTMGLRPFGLFLSGGLDSTVILHELVTCSKNLVNTYTTRFEAKDSRYNEDADLAQQLTSDYNINHHELFVTEHAFVSHYEDAIRAMEEPRYNHSVPAYWMLSEIASKDITIILNGSGGDELFLGYPRYINAQNIESKYWNYPTYLLDLFFTWKAIREGIVSPRHFLHLGETIQEWFYVNKITPVAGNPVFRFMKGFDIIDAATAINHFTIPPLTDPLSDRLNTIGELDRYFWLANEEFLRTDKIIMNFGMEGRFPFLARDIIRYANSISSEIKLAHGPKSFMRDAYRGVLPDYIVNKKKTGWNAPVVEWMHGEFGEMVNEVLSSRYYAPTADLFDFHTLKKRELRGKSEFTLADLKRFLPVVQFQVWARAFNVQLD